MRKNFLPVSMLISFILCANIASAKIWRLNNNGNNPIPAIGADFTGTLQAVHDNASVLSGDTIHLEQSPTTYGNCIFTKRLVLIGPGYYLNTNPQTQVNTDYGATVGTLTFYNAGSAGSKVYGLQVSTTYLGVDNVLLSRCYVTSFIYLGNTTTGNIDGIAIRQCIMNYNAGTNGVAIRNNTGTGLLTNVEITNNIINPTSFAFPISLNNKVSGILKNNILYSYYGSSVENFYVLNNISYSSAGSGNGFTNCVIEYNIGSNNAMFVSPGGTGNTIGTGNQTKSLAQIAFTTSNPNDAYWQLAVSSECIGAGKSGVDCGVFSGDYVYKLSGLPPVPNIYSLTIAPIPAGASSISVSVSAKGNN